MKFTGIIVAASAALCTIAGASAAAAIEVNIDAASSTGTDVTLGPGTYDVTEIKGLYTSADLWNDGGVGNDGVNRRGQPIPCATSSTCTYGYRPTFEISIDGGHETTYSVPVPKGDYPATYVSAAEALAAFEAYQAVNPITITLTSTSRVDFLTPDVTSYCDDTGGISLSIVPATPEPSTWLLMIGGVAGAGLLLRRAKKTTGSSLNEGVVA
jgi:hypothetical protein